MHKSLWLSNHSSYIKMNTTVEFLFCLNFLAFLQWHFKMIKFYIKYYHVYVAIRVLQMFKLKISEIFYSFTPFTYFGIFTWPSDNWPDRAVLVLVLPFVYELCDITSKFCQSKQHTRWLHFSMFFAVFSCSFTFSDVHIFRFEKGHF